MADNRTSEDLSKAKKYAIYVAGGLALFLVGRWAVRKWKDAQIARSYNTAIANLTTNKSNLTIDEQQATVKANQLYSYMEGWGTEDASIMAVLSTLKTADDWKLVIKKFGTRPYGEFGAPIIGSGSPLDLIGWLRKELNSSDLIIVENTIASLGLAL